MAKTALLKKADIRQGKQVKKTATKSVAKMTPAKKKPQLKVVKNSPAAVKTKKTAAKKPAAKLVPVKAAPVKAKPAAVKKPATAAKPAAKQAVAQKPVTAKQAAPAKKAAAPAGARSEFRIGDHVVYPTHGVGRIVSEETQQIGEISLRMLVISFEKDRMTLRVPVTRAAAAGLRHISGNEQIGKVFTTLKSRARASRGMWSRRAQEYEAKINSGNIMSIAEVVRDLHHNVDQAERSYSERMIYESALSRLVGELAAAENTDQKNATDKLMKLLRSKAAA